MRPLASSRLTALAIAAAISLGTAGPAFADVHQPAGATAAARAPVPGADALLAQTKALGDVGSVLTPVTDLLDAALKAEDGQLPAADAEALKAKVTTAIEAVKGAAPAPLPETPPVEAPAVEAPAVEAPAVEAPAVEAPAVEAPALPVGVKAAVAKAAPADLIGDALATVEKAVADLVAAITSGDPSGVVSQVTATLTSLVNLAVSTVLGAGLPAPNLPGLPTLPSLPVEVPELPVETPELPVAAAPELPVKPPLPIR